MSVQGPSPKVTGEGHTVGGSAAAPSGRPQAKAPNFALAWQFVSSLSAGAPPGPPGAAAQAAQAAHAAHAAHAHRAAGHSPNVPRAGSPLVAPGVRSPRAVSPPAGKSPAPAPQACSPQVGRLGCTAPPNNRVQLGKAAPWNRMETSPRPNSPPHVIRIQSPLYKDSQSPRFLMKHPSHPQLHSASAHAPPGGMHPVRWSGGTTQVSPRVRTSSPPPQQSPQQQSPQQPSPQQPPQPRQSHLLPVALANSVAAAAAAHAAGHSQEHPEMPGVHPSHPVPLGQHGPGQPGQSGPCQPPHQPPQPGQPGQAMIQVQQMQQKMQMQVPHPQIQKQLQLQQMQMQQFQQVHSQPGQSGQVHLIPPMPTDPLQTQPLDATSVIRKPSSDITQVPSRRASNATLSPAGSPLLTNRAVATVHSPYGEGKSTAPTQLLWALHVEAASQSLLHQWEARCELPVTQRVGLLFQKDFFTSILSDEEISMVDREQFQIWAVDSNGSDRSCSFFLTNFSSNGTMVNNQLLCIGGEQVPLKDGDRIALLRERGAGMETLLEFRFDLSGSILKDLAAWLLPSRLAARPSALPTLASIPSSVAEPSPPTPREAMPQPELFSAEKKEDPEDEASPRPSAEGVSFLGVPPLPLFSLELGGEGLQNDVREEDLKIIHGPVAPKTEGPAGSCLPLLLGRSAQRSFWQRILCSNAFYAMSRQHLQFEVGEEFSVSSSATFYVRNLSSSNPVRICRTSLQEEMQAAAPLEMGEKRQLQDRDVIVLNPVQGYSLWLIFSDLWAKRTDAPENGANVTEPK